MEVRAQFFSDLHIQRGDDSRAVLFSQTLRQLVGHSTHIFLLGDIFDLWIADHSYFQQRYQSILDALQLLRDSGAEIHLFEGNHDMQFGPFWTEQMRFHIHPDSALFHLGPWHVRLEHGDLMNPDDRSYLALRWFLRTRLLRWIGQSVTGEFIASFADPWSQHSRKARRPSSPHDQSARELRIRAMMHAYAHRTFQQANPSLDFIITGHTHIRDEYPMEQSGHRCEFINLGSWYESPAYYELTTAGGTWHILKPIL